MRLSSVSLAALVASLTCGPLSHASGLTASHPNHALPMTFSHARRASDHSQGHSAHIEVVGPEAVDTVQVEESSGGRFKGESRRGSQTADCPGSGAIFAREEDSKPRGACQTGGGAFTRSAPMPLW